MDASHAICLKRNLHPPGKPFRERPSTEARFSSRRRNGSRPNLLAPPLGRKGIIPDRRTAPPREALERSRLASAGPPDCSEGPPPKLTAAFPHQLAHISLPTDFAMSRPALSGPAGRAAPSPHAWTRPHIPQENFASKISGPAVQLPERSATASSASCGKVASQGRRAALASADLRGAEASAPASAGMPTALNVRPASRPGS